MTATVPATRVARKALASLVALVVVVPLVATAASADPGTDLAPDPAPEVLVEADDGFEPDVSTRIVGGTQAAPGAWPSQVGLLFADMANTYQAQFCGGTVIHQWWVLTAAHCVIQDDGTARVTAAELDILVGTQSLARGGERIRAREIRLVSGYQGGPPERDLALVRLSRPTSVPVQELIASGAAVPAGTAVTATGWGTTAFGTTSFPYELRQVTVSALANASCSNYGGFFKSSSMLCAGDLGGGKDACQGDSGGPLVRNVSGRWIQVGITSWGNECARSGFPGIYTKVSAFRAWIDQQVRFGPHRTTAGFVNQTYRDLFGRLPTTTERSNALDALNRGTSPHALLGQLIQGTTYQRSTGGVTRLYLAYFGRYPDQTGMVHWWERINDGWSLAQVSQAFAGSAEFRNRYGSLTNGQFVDLVYQNVLGRPADPSGRAYWLDHLNRRTRTRGAVMTGFSESLEYRRSTKAEVDVVITWFGMLRHRPAPATVAAWRDRPNSQLIAHLFESAPYYGRR